MLSFHMPCVIMAMIKDRSAHGSPHRRKTYRLLGVGLVTLAYIDPLHLL